MQIGRWSKSRYGRSDVLFVTVCVDIRPKPVAREFQRTYFDKAGSSIINAFIEERNDYPNFPTQLGCQGLLVLDCEGNIATFRLSESFRGLGTLVNSLPQAKYGSRLQQPLILRPRKVLSHQSI